MIHVKVTNGTAVTDHRFTSDGEAQKFLEKLQKNHIKRYSLGKLENMKKKVHELAHKECSNVRKLQGMQSRLFYALRDNPVKPIPLKVEICKV